MTYTTTIDSMPSRHDNPFATCWTRPGALPFHFADGESIEQLITKLCGQRWWGEITGTHGSGKSTLLAALIPALVAAGWRVQAVTLRKGQRRLPDEFQEQLRNRHSGYLGASLRLFIVDGYEQLSRFARWRLTRACRRAGAGLVVTSHAPTGLPELVRLAPDGRLVQQIVRELCAQVSASVATADIDASHACHGSNVREILFDLYERHERLRRAARTPACAGA